LAESLGIGLRGKVGRNPCGFDIPRFAGFFALVTSIVETSSFDCAQDDPFGTGVLTYDIEEATREDEIAASLRSWQ